MSKLLEEVRKRIRQNSVPIQGLPLSISRHLVTNKELTIILTELRLRNTQGGAYVIFNPYNPDIPLFQEGDVYKVRIGFEDHPAVGVTWGGAQRIAKIIGARLPTVSEWEKAAGEGAYPWGEESPSPSLANYGENVGQTTPVGSYPASVHGIYDLSGNVGEWCNFDESDAFLSDEFPVKGGGWNKSADTLRNSSVRHKWKRIGTVGIGFRPVFSQIEMG